MNSLKPADRSHAKLTITLSRTASNRDEGDYISIVVKRDSGVHVAKIELSLPGLADLLTGRAEVPCEGTLYRQDGPALAGGKGEACN